MQTNRGCVQAWLTDSNSFTMPWRDHIFICEHIWALSVEQVSSSSSSRLIIPHMLFSQIHNSSHSVLTDSTSNCLWKAWAAILKGILHKTPTSPFIPSDSLSSACAVNVMVRQTQKGGLQSHSIRNLLRFNVFPSGQIFSLWVKRERKTAETLCSAKMDCRNSCSFIYFFLSSSKISQLHLLCGVILRCDRVFQSWKVLSRPSLTLNSFYFECITFLDWRVLSCPANDHSNQRWNILYPPTIVPGCHVETRLFQERHKWTFIINGVRNTCCMHIDFSCLYSSCACMCYFRIL